MLIVYSGLSISSYKMVSSEQDTAIKSKLIAIREILLEKRNFIL